MIRLICVSMSLMLLLFETSPVEAILVAKSSAGFHPTITPTDDCPEASPGKTGKKKGDSAVIFVTPADPTDPTSPVKVCSTKDISNLIVCYACFQPATVSPPSPPSADPNEANWRCTKFDNLEASHGYSIPPVVVNGKTYVPVKIWVKSGANQNTGDPPPAPFNSKGVGECFERRSLSPLSPWWQFCSGAPLAAS